MVTPVTNAPIPFNRPSVVGKEIENILDAIERGRLSGDGHFTELCSARIVQLTGAKSALLTHSCTAALEMASILCDLGEGDEVVMPSFTFVSTANAVALRRATPVFVDVAPGTLNIDPAAAERAVTPRTKAICAVHYAGSPADMDALRAVCNAHDLALIEDAAQALGSLYKGRPAGSLGDLAAFSFHETKNLISGEGGALAINNEQYLERAEIIREKGTNRKSFSRGEIDRYSWVDIGSSFLPGELIAAFLYGQLERHEEILARRRALFDRYEAAFQDLAAAEEISLPVIPADRRANGHMFYFLLRSEQQRSAFIAHMGAHGVGTPFHYVPLHSAPAGKRLARTHGSLSVTEDSAKRLVRLPMFFELEDGADRVIELVRAFFKR